MEQNNFYLKDSLGHQVKRTGRLLSTKLHRQFQTVGYDITSEQWEILLSLWDKDGQNQKEIAFCNKKDKGSITKLIAGLEKRGFVIRIEDDHDRRNKLIYLTKTGKESREKLESIARGVLNNACKGVDEKELEVCRRVMSKLCENINNEL